MAVQSGVFGSSIAKKYWMALTGFFLVIFLIVHLAGNLQLLDLSEAGRMKFNEYTLFMTTFPLVKITSYLLYFSLLFHAIDGLMLAYQNRAARSQRYKVYRPGQTSMWSSRNMGVLGTIILAFVILHMAQFWYTYKWGAIGTDAVGNKDMSAVVIETFTDDKMGLVFVILYVISMIAIAFHLWHGFESMFQSMGISSKRAKVWRVIGRIFAVVVPLLFAIIPVYVYFNA